jgi:hypothetical protein
MSTAPIFVNALADFYKANPYGPGFARQIEPFCKNIGPDMASEIAGAICSGSKSFPTLKTCQRALREAEARLLAPTNTSVRPWERQKAKDDAEWQARLAAIRLCRCDLGRQADREGWLTTLLEFCQDEGRLPEAREIEALKRRNREVDDNLHRRPLPINYASLCNLRKAMLERAHKDVFAFGGAEA